MKFKLTSAQLQKWGVFLSIACAIHCALMPLLLVLLPLVGMEFLSSHFWELMLLMLSIGLAGAGILKSFRNQHPIELPLGLLILGGTIVMVAHFGIPENINFFFTPIGALCIGASQVINIRRQKRCETCVKL